MEVRTGCIKGCPAFSQTTVTEKGKINAVPLGVVDDGHQNYIIKKICKPVYFSPSRSIEVCELFRLTLSLNGSNGEATGKDDVECCICMEPVFRRPNNMRAWDCVGHDLGDRIAVSICHNHHIHENCMAQSYRYRGANDISAFREFLIGDDLGGPLAQRSKPNEGFQCPVCLYCTAPPRALTTNVFLDSMNLAVYTSVKESVGAPAEAVMANRNTARKFSIRRCTQVRQFLRDHPNPRPPILRNQPRIPVLPPLTPEQIQSLADTATDRLGAVLAPAPNHVVVAPVIVANPAALPPPQVPVVAVPPAVPALIIQPPANHVVNNPAVLPLVALPVQNQNPPPAVQLPLPNVGGVVNQPVAIAVVGAPAPPAIPATNVALGPIPVDPAAAQLIVGEPDIRRDVDPFFLPESQNNLVETVVFYIEKPSAMCIVVMAFLLCIATLVLIGEDHYKMAARFFIFVIFIVGWDCLAFASLCYRQMFSGFVWSWIKEFNRIQQEDIDCVIYSGSGANPAQGIYATPIYGKFDQMGVEISVISTSYTHYRRVFIYRDAFEFLWNLRAGCSDNTLLMSWMLGEATRKYKIENGYKRLRMEFTVHVVYQCIVSARLKERKAQHPGSTATFNRVAF